MLYPVLTPDLCAELARDEFGIQGGYRNKTNKALDEEICQSLIGTSYDVCSEIWNLIDPQKKDELKNAEPKHLFWVLLFLKTYCIEPVLRRVVGGVDAGTFRNWSRKFLKEVSDLKPRVIIFSNRFNQWNGTAICVISAELALECINKNFVPPEDLRPDAPAERSRPMGMMQEASRCGY
jgi:hypothetical protein